MPTEEQKKLCVSLQKAIHHIDQSIITIDDNYEGLFIKGEISIDAINAISQIAAACNAKICDIVPYDNFSIYLRCQSR